MSYFGSQKFFDDLQRDFNNWFGKRNMEACRQAMENQPGRIDLATAIREAYRNEVYNNDKEFMHFISSATGALREGIITLFQNQEFMKFLRMFDMGIHELDAERVKNVFAGIDKGLDFNAAYEAGQAPRP